MSADADPRGAHLSAGTLVRHDGPDGPEFGVVVQCWLDSELQVFDCYVAFFGHERSGGPPKQKPYVLRYASLSLTVIDS